MNLGLLVKILGWKSFGVMCVILPSEAKTSLQIISVFAMKDTTSVHLIFEVLTIDGYIMAEMDKEKMLKLCFNFTTSVNKYQN